MTDYIVKITLVASIILMGYNISEFVASFKSVSEKIGDFLGMAKANSATNEELRRSNCLISGVLSMVYVLLVYFSDVVLWLVALVFVKLALTLFLSDKLLVHVLRDGSLSKKDFLISKYDSLLNALMGLAFALILVL